VRQRIHGLRPAQSGCAAAQRDSNSRPLPSEHAFSIVRC
jgi:hypothetical protein